MNKNEYWELFKETGKIEDYIKYCNLKNEENKNTLISLK